MRKLILVGVSFTGALLAMTTEAKDTSIQISPRVGYGELLLDADKTLSGNKETLDSLDVGVTIGVVAPFGLLLEGGVQRDYSETFFGADDHYELSQMTLAIGYQFETASRVRFIPKVGRTHWRLYDDAGWLSASSSADERRLEGYDYFWEFTLQKRVGRGAALGVTVKDNEFDFGSARSVAFTMTFDL